MRTWNLGSQGPTPEELEAIAALLLAGGVVLLPTDTIYGLHACAGDGAAVQRIVELKGRDGGKPLVILGSDIEQLQALGVEFGPGAAAVLRSIWPAPLTAILPLSRTVSRAVAATRGAATAAARVPAVSWLRELLRRTGPLASTSANRSGEPAVTEPQQLPARIADRIDGIISGTVLENAASTIVDFTAEIPKVIRQGDFFFTQNLWKTLWISL